MRTRKLNSLEKTSSNISKWINSSAAFGLEGLDNVGESLQQGKRQIRKNVKGIWNKRLELFFGFVPALLVFVITYGKKFK